MSEPLEFMLKSSIFDRSRKLTLDPEYLEFDDNDRMDGAPTRFEKSEVEGIKYGIRGIRGYNFRIGRIYTIDIRDREGRVIKLRLKSIYRIRIRQLEQKYQQIRKFLFEFYFHDLVRQYIKKLGDGETLSLGGVDFKPEGVIFDEKVGLISWDFLGTKKYHYYYTLFSAENPDQYKAFNYLDQWNAGVIHSLTETMIKVKFPGVK